MKCFGKGNDGVWRLSFEGYSKAYSDEEVRVLHKESPNLWHSIELWFSKSVGDTLTFKDYMQEQIDGWEHPSIQGVKVIAPQGCRWYSAHVGEVFPYAGITEHDGFQTFEPSGYINFILENDAVVVYATNR